MRRRCMRFGARGGGRDSECAAACQSKRPPFLAGRMNPEGRKALIRLAVMFGWIAVAFVVGSVAGSVNVFIVVMVVGLVVSLVLRFTLLR
jgi:uncharacterized membrane-anchored protein